MIADQLDPRRNSLNFLRLVFATLVIVSHMWPIGGYGGDPTFFDISLGGWAVVGFFAISGYLIANSRIKSSFPDFLMRRLLRIYPAYLVCIVVVALVFAPLSTLIDHSAMSWGNAARYIGVNLFLKNQQTGITDTLQSVPYPDIWNGSLWTLFYEFGCYLVVGVLLSRAAWRGRAIAIAFLTSALGDIVLTQGVHRGGSIPENFLWLGASFFAGSLLALYADRVRLDYRIALGCVVATALGGYLEVLPLLGALPAAYLCLWAGARLPFVAVGRRNDISYGVYIYAFPVQQFLTLLHVNRLPVWIAILFAIAWTVPFAAASWFLVENPALQLKKRFTRRPPAHAARASLPVG